MRQRPRGVCRLCKKEAALCDSHLIPAAAYCLLRAPTRRNPNPVHVGPEKAFTSSRHVKDYLLCADCEQRFDKNGEKWTLSHCSQPNRSFPIREALLASQPVYRDAALVLYEARNIRSIDTEKLVYFGLSVHWRAAVHKWRDVDGHALPGIDLGPYEERLRLFLLNQSRFPTGMALMIRVSGLTNLVGMLTKPESGNKSGYHTHVFFIPGIEFTLLVGSRIPDEELSISTSPAEGRFIAASPKRDRFIVNYISRRITRTPAAGVKT